MGGKWGWIKVSVSMGFPLPIFVLQAVAFPFTWDSGKCDLESNFVKSTDVICSLKFKSVSLDCGVIEVG